MEDAIGEVANPIQYNRAHLLAPLGKDASWFEDAVKSLTNIDLVQYGNGTPAIAMSEDARSPLEGGSLAVEDQFGRMVARTALSADDIREHEMQFVTVGPGRYSLFIAGLGFILTTDGERYEIDLSRYVPRVIDPLPTEQRDERERAKRKMMSTDPVPMFR
jgi:hypothetical protein